MINVKLDREEKPTLEDFLLEVRDGCLSIGEIGEDRLFLFQVNGNKICVLQYLPLFNGEDDVLTFWEDVSYLTESPQYSLADASYLLDNLSNEHLNAEEVFIKRIVVTKERVN